MGNPLTPENSLAMEQLTRYAQQAKEKDHRSNMVASIYQSSQQICKNPLYTKIVQSFSERRN